MKYMIFISMALLTTCSKRSADNVMEKESIDAQAQTVIVIENVDTCFPARRVIDSLIDFDVTVIKKNERFFFGYDNTHLEVCDMPNPCKVDSASVKISGDLLEILPNERRMGRPFRLKKVSL